MTAVTADRVKETTTTTGTGALTLAGAAIGYRAFSAVCSVGDTVGYAIEDGAGGWEVGNGTYSGANTLTRTAVYASSNGNAAVNFGAGNKSVFLTLTASQVDGKVNSHGFPINSSGAYLCSLTYNETTRTVTITPTGASFDVYVKGVKFTKTGAQSIVHSAAGTGLFIYYDETGTLVSTTSVWDETQVAPVAFVFQDVANSRRICFEERHHAESNVYWHRNQHINEGTKASGTVTASGYTLLDGSTDAAVTFAIASLRIEDEDIRVDTQALPDGGPYTILERVGASGDWQITRTSTLPFLFSGNNLQYNQNNAGTWQRTNLAEDMFVNYFVFGVPALPTTDTTPAPTTTQQIVIVAGQASYASLALAHGETFSSLAWGTVPFQELVPLYQITLRYNAANPAAYTNTARCAIQTFARTVGTAATVTQAAQTDHGSLSGLSDLDHPASAIINTPAGNIAATTVQDAINELDAEKASPALAQTWTAPQIGGVGALAVSANAVAVDMATRNNFSLTLQATTGQTLSNPTNAVAGQAGQIVITQNATPSTLAFGANWIPIDGVTPTVSTTAGAQNLLSYYVADSTHIWFSLNKHGVA